MNTELQDLAWSVLPNEFKEEVKKMFQKDINTCNNMNQAMRCILVDIFGIHNLTSYSENLSEPKPSEPRFKVGDKVKIAKNGNVYNNSIGEIIDISSNGSAYILFCNGQAWFRLTDLEPYTEPQEKSRNLSQETANCDKHFDNILKDSFRNERRLNIATQIMSSILSNQMMLNNLAHGETTVDGVVRCIVNATMMYTDTLIAECEKGGSDEKD